MTRLFKTEFALALILALGTVGSAIPYGNRLYWAVSIIYFVFFLISGRLSIKPNLGMGLIFLCIFFYLTGLAVSFFNNINISRIILRDLMGIFIVTLLCSMFNEYDLKSMTNHFIRLAVIVAFVLAVFSIYKYYLFCNGIFLDYLYEDGSISSVYPLGTSLVDDYNSYALGALCGLVSAFYYIKSGRSKLFKIFSLIVLLLLIIDIVLCGSRRGITCLVLFLLWIAYLGHRSWVKNFKTIIFSYFIILTALVLGISSRIAQVFSFIPEDITMRYLTLIQAIYGDIDRVGERIDIWRLSFELLGRYNFTEILFGNGFNYLVAFEQHGGYPHNPFLAAMFYSGIVGLLAVIGMYCYFAIDILNKRYILPGCFIWITVLSVLFSMISCNSIFAWSSLMLTTVFIFNLRPLKKRPYTKVNLISVDSMKKREKVFYLSTPPPSIP